MVNARLSEITQRPDAPFAYGGTGRGAFTRTRDVHSALRGDEGKRVRAAPPTPSSPSPSACADSASRRPSSIAPAPNYLRALEQAYAERDKTNSSVFAGQYVSSALNETPILNIADEQTLAQRFAPTVTLAELNALARASFPKQDRVVIVAAPDKPEIKLPSKAIDARRVRSRRGRRDAHGVRRLDVGRAARRHAADARARSSPSARSPRRESSSGSSRTARGCCSSPPTSSATRCCSPRRARAGSPSLPIRT